MKRIISVSRRTDIPAFYGQWFMRRLKDGFAGVVSPFGGKKYIASLKQEDVVCFVFWSKDFTPFVGNLKTISNLGYRLYFNYTVTGLPAVFESNVNKGQAVETLKLLSKTYSPKHINWRYDPIIISTVCDADFHIRAFEKLACEFEGLVERCYFSFVVQYNKVKRNFSELAASSGISTSDWIEDLRIELANKLAAIAYEHGITMYSCCGDYLVNEQIRKGHCIDGSVIEGLFFPEGLAYQEKPTRLQCGCTESIDIGTYDTCPHGCVYCYANANKDKAQHSYTNHDMDSAFLGFTQSQSDIWLEEIRDKNVPTDGGQPKLF